MNGEDICVKCKRFLCKIKQNKNETNLECFLRYIRNSIIHSRVSYKHNENKISIMFEDENTSKKLSDRIVCIKADLVHWKNVLNDVNNYK